MGEKKQKPAVRSVYKVLAIIGCVLFVVLMVVSSMGSSWITAFRAVRPGDAVTIGITIRDGNGDPLVTSDEALFREKAGAGSNIFYARQLVVVANQSAAEELIPIPVYSASEGWSGTFALFGDEYDLLSRALVGMKTNEQKTVTIPFSDSMTQTWSAAQLTNQGVNLTEIHVGDTIAMAVASESAPEANASASAYSVRPGEVTQKSAGSVTINLGYPSIDVTVVAIGAS